MLSKCANPACPTPFRYLRDGHVYQFERPVEPAESGPRQARRLEYFWLCGPCSQTLTLALDERGQVSVAPRREWPFLRRVA